MIQISLVAAAAASLGAAQPAPAVTLPALDGPALSEDEVWAVWPTVARSVGMHATVTLNCVVTRSGAAEDCHAKTSKRDLGFEAAALPLASKLRFRPGTIDGQPVDMAVALPINFACGTRCAPFSFASGRDGVIVFFPNWRAQPKAADIDAVFPPAARTAGIEGTVVLRCNMRQSQDIAGCVVTEETPKGQGFGDAAMRLSVYFRAQPAATQPGSAPYVRAVVRFRLGRGRSSAAARAEAETRPPASAPANQFEPGVTVGEVGPPPTPTPQDPARMGEADLICRPLVDRRFDDCLVLRESPQGSGLGQAALSLSKSLRAETTAYQKLAERGGYVTIPFLFKEAP